MITPEQVKPLSEWIRSFATITIGQQQLLDGNNNSTTTALPADNYLIPALRIASSLADQICKAQEAGQSPTPSSDWMDSIVVHLRPNGSEDGRFVGKAAEDEDEDGEGGNNNNIRVEILPSLLFNTTDNNNSRQATDGVLYSLGIVFYEIFSRGERPAELKQQQVGEKPSHSGTEELCEDLDPLPFDQGGNIDLARELNISPFNRFHDIGELTAFDDLQDEYNDIWGLNNDSYEVPQGQHPKRRNINNHRICSVSVEPLKAKGLPRA